MESIKLDYENGNREKVVQQPFKKEFHYPLEVTKALIKIFHRHRNCG
jgi:hypothetical protein